MVFVQTSSDGDYCVWTLSPVDNVIKLFTFATDAVVN